jgi:hypothetical protein
MPMNNPRYAANRARVAAATKISVRYRRDSDGSKFIVEYPKPRWNDNWAIPQISGARIDTTKLV